MVEQKPTEKSPIENWTAINDIADLRIANNRWTPAKFIEHQNAIAAAFDDFILGKFSLPVSEIVRQIPEFVASLELLDINGEIVNQEDEHDALYYNADGSSFSTILFSLGKAKGSALARARDNKKNFRVIAAITEKFDEVSRAWKAKNCDVTEISMQLAKSLNNKVYKTLKSLNAARVREFMEAADQIEADLTKTIQNIFLEYIGQTPSK